MDQACLRDAKSFAAFRSWREMRYRFPGLRPRVLHWIGRDRRSRARALLWPWWRDGCSFISAAMALPTGWWDELLEFASLSTRSAGPGIHKAGLPACGGCSNIFLFLECRRRRL